MLPTATKHFDRPEKILCTVYTGPVVVFYVV